MRHLGLLAASVRSISQVALAWCCDHETTALWIRMELLVVTASDCCPQLEQKSTYTFSISMWSLEKLELSPSTTSPWALRRRLIPSSRAHLVALFEYGRSKQDRTSGNGTLTEEIGFCDFLQASLVLVQIFGWCILWACVGRNWKPDEAYREATRRPATCY
jgi:hypothetical protein